jgi:phospholipase C
MSSIEHVVVLMMENRSFDEYFGTFPGAAGFYDGSSSIEQPWPSQPGGTLYPWRLSTFTTNALISPQLPHDWVTNHVAINDVNGPAGPDNRGFFASSGGDPAAMGCYLADDIPYHWALAQNFALCDRYHCSVLAGTGPNRMYLLGGTICDPALTPVNGVFQGSETGTRYDGTDPVLYNLYSPPGPEQPTSTAHWHSYLADLVQAGASYRIYDDWNWQFDGGTGPTKVDLNVFAYYEPYQGAAGAVTLGTLGDPNYFAPNYAPNSEGTPGDDRPLFAQHVNPRNPAEQPPVLAPLTWLMPPYNYSEHPPYTSSDGAYYIAQIVDALMQSEFWDSTALVITYDEGNNAFDHLPPPLSPNPAGEPQPQLWEPWVQDDSGTADSGREIDYPAAIGGGMRVPAIVVSPWTYRRGVVSDNLDHTSILQLMETVSGIQCSTLPAAGSPLGWRREIFADLHAVIDPQNHAPTPAQEITSLPTAAVTVQQWRTNADNRAQRQAASPPAPPASQSGPPVPQACSVTLSPASYRRRHVLDSAGDGASVTFPNAISVTVTGFQAQEFVELDAGVPPPQSLDDLPQVPVAGGGTCRTRVPALEVVQGAPPGEIVIGDCSQVSADPSTLTDQEAPLQLSFTFPLTFADPQRSFAFSPRAPRVLGVRASLTVDACVTATTSITLAGGNLRWWSRGRKARPGRAADAAALARQGR